MKNQFIDKVKIEKREFYSLNALHAEELSFTYDTTIVSRDKYKAKSSTYGTSNLNTNLFYKHISRCIPKI